jgi:peptide/nickel transport system permease protein
VSFWRPARAAKAARAALLTVAVVALLADFLASDRPVVCRFDGVFYLLPNVTHPAALAGADPVALRDGVRPGDWSLRPLVASGPREGAALVGAPRVAPPFASAGHPLGTDEAGRDVFARLVHGARTSLGIGLLAALVFVAVGAVLGGFAGFYGGVVDALVGRVIETLTPFPTLILVIVVQALLERPSVGSMLLAIGLTRWTEVARVVRAEVLLVASQDYALAARALGVRPLRVLVRHIAPNAATPVLVTAAFGLAQVVLIESSLAFLRVGVDTSVSWGEMLSEARGHPGAYWLLVFPGLAIFVVVASLNLLGESLRDALDPRLARAADRPVDIRAPAHPAAD